MSNLKLVAGTMKRRGIAIAAAVAVSGGSLATANYAMAVEVDESSFNELHNEFSGTDAGTVAVDTANEAATALKNGATDDEVRQILQNGLKSAAGVHGADFSKEDLEKSNADELQAQLQETVASAKQTLEAKKGRSADQSSTPQAPAQSPEAKWASPAPAGKYSPQRLEAEFGNTTEGKIAEETAKVLAEALQKTGNKQELESIVEEGLKNAGFQNDEIQRHKAEIEEIVTGAFQQHNLVKAELQHEKQSALTKLASLDKLNPLQRDIFKKQIESAKNKDAVMTVLTAAKAEQKNPVAPFAPVPGQETPSEAPDTDVEKALDYTKAEALEKLRGLSHLTEQQKAFYEKMVNDADHVHQVEDAYEAGVAKDKVNGEAKKASGFLAKAIARTKHLALEKLDGFEHLTHEQKKEARNKILAAKQVFEVEAAFHGAEKLNKAAK
ncbi:hypothetical protein PQG75_00780 [Corynebacterium pseudodiphtheriticum]|uniref:GA module-containing protein n=1 Tax=Corynebacterium pseudodiphtheriticum TaxID=37637 RepID=UPI00234E2C0B|nr:hypothetical protein [Corynebacterium pseudodiphtheriticum]MDC7111912.1 hypothetical protein [Corynebacterium pseudodiphtheriticum]